MYKLLVIIFIISHLSCLGAQENDTVIEPTVPPLELEDVTEETFEFTTQINENIKDNQMEEEEKEKTEELKMKHPNFVEEFSEKNCRKHYYTNFSFNFNFLLDAAVSNPRARLYFGANLTGDFEDYNFSGKSNPSCSWIDTLNGRLQSIETFGTCIRLYNNSDFCHGPSIAIYPTNTQNQTEPSSLSLQSLRSNFIQNALSIGPCFTNELDDSVILSSDSGTTGYQKLMTVDNFPFVPELVFFGGMKDDNFTGDHPIIQYGMDKLKRIVYLRALINQTDVLRGKTGSRMSEEDKKYYAELADKMDGDKLGYFILPILGSQPQLPFYNIFAQNPQARNNIKVYQQNVVDWLSQSQNKGKWVWMDINVDYGSTGSRPRGLSIKIDFHNEFTTINYVSNLMSKKNL